MATSKQTSKDNNLIRKSNANIFNNISNFFQKASEMRKADKIIKKLEMNKEYDVYSVPAFKQKVSKVIDENPNGVLFSIDINNLYEANQNTTKEVVNKDIKSIIDQIKENVNEYSKSENSYIAKLGDEISIYIENMNYEKAEPLLDNLRKIESGALSISCGMTSETQNGLSEAMQLADKEMYTDKKRHKYEELVNFCGKDYQKVIEYIMNKRMHAARINLNNIRDNSTLMKYVNIYDNVISNVNLEELISNINIETAEEQQLDKYLARTNNYKNEARRKFGKLSPKEEDKYILSKMLKTGNFENTINNEYFQEFEKGDLEGKNIQIMAIDISGLKAVNDKYGHEEGDRQIQNVIEEFRNVLDKENIKTLSNIVVKGAGNSFVVIKPLSEKEKANVINSLDSQNTKLDVQCSIKGYEDLKPDDKKENDLNDILKVAENELEIKSLNKKVTSQENVIRLIQDTYIEIFNNDTIRGLMDSKVLEKEKIISFVKSNFKAIIDEHTANSQVNQSTPEKEKEVKQDEKEFKSVNNNKEART